MELLEKNREKIRPAEELKAIKLLFVEDEEIIRNSFKKMIERKVNRLYLGEDGEDGYNKFLEYKPDIIITDIQMPKLNGIEMIEKIRKVDKKVKILIVSAFNDSNYLLRAIENDVSGYLVKPVNKQKLYKQLNDLAKLITGEREKNKIYDIINQVINMQENMIVVVGENRFRLANRGFLEFFGVKTVEEFNEKIDFCGELEKGKDYFYMSDYLSLYDCIGNMEFERHNALQVSMRDRRDNKSKVFLVKITTLNDLTKHSHVLTFTNITDISLKSKYYERKATFDELTNIFNRTKFNEYMKDEIEICKRRELPLCVILFDIDKFKSINDTYGHLIGDEVLKKLANIVKSTIRKTDIFARWGGEEFILLLPKVKIDMAKNIAENIRENIEKSSFPEVGKVTCSFGVSQFRYGDNQETFVKRADEALYRAKKNGRNRVELEKLA